MSTLAVRVYFEDTDFTGRVYHGAYVRFLERGRTEHLRAAGIDHHALASAERPLFFTIRGMTLSFHGPALIDDLLTIESIPAMAGRATFRFGQKILRGTDLLVRAEVELCLIDAAGRPARPDAELLAALSEC